ncbi:MAG TPA: PAS domain-containing protein [Herbaspirillum sp.]|nr:PAS domain-containing protein [Herbaspirillum sp.]
MAQNKEQKRREAERDIAITRFEMSREILNDGIWDLTIINGDPFNQDNEFWWSPQFRRLLGFETEAEFPNVLGSWASRLHPDDIGAVMSAFSAHVSDKSGKTPYDIEYRLRDKNDVYHHFSARGQTKRAPDGTPLRAIGALTNIDHLKSLLAAERAKIQYQLMLVSGLKDIREEERLALAREVHDQLGQVLSAAKIDIKLLEDGIRPVDAPLSRRKIAKELRSARLSIEKAIQSVREIATNLRSPELEDHGLFATLKWHARDFERRNKIKCSIHISDAVSEPRGLIAVVLFRIFQEATTNILRHAKAGKVWISLDRRGAMILLRVRDDGVGIRPALARSSHAMGIQGMRERVAIVKGRLIVAALRPQGTLVSVRIPVITDGDALRLLLT